MSRTSIVWMGSPLRGSGAADRELHTATHPRFVLACLSTAMLLASLGTSIVNVGLPTLAATFRASFPQTQWVVLGYLLAVTSLSVSAGRLGDIVGRRKLFIVGLGIFTASAVACGLAPTLNLLIAARVVQGIGAAIMLSLTLALAGEAVPRERTGTAMGLLGTMSAVGTALGPTLGGFLIAHYGWAAIFLLLAVVGMALFALALWILPADELDSGELRAGFDLTGTLLLALALVTYTLSMTTGRETSGMPSIALIAASILGAALFYYWQCRSAQPLIQFSMFHDRTLSTGLVLNTVVSAVLMATLVVGPFYLTGALGLDPAVVGLVMTAGPAIVALSGMPAGRLVEGFGAFTISLAGLAGIGIGSALLWLFPLKLGIPGYVLPVMIITLGYALFQTANGTAILSRAAPAVRGATSGMLNLSRSIGLVSGTAVMGALFAHATGTTDFSHAQASAIARGLQVTFGASCAMTTAAFVLGMLRRPVERSAG